MNPQLLERKKTYPNFESCSIQTFNDKNKEDKAYSRILPMTEENLKRCEELQKTQPYGIYFSVNPMEEGKRNKDSVKFIQTWICDIDEWTKEEQKKLIEKAPLTPSLVVESVHWFHLYYLSNKNLTDDEYTKWNLWLMTYYHWDIKVCKDKARVLRIPWFYHMKWEKQLVVYRDDLSCWLHYSKEEMDLAFPQQEEKDGRKELVEANRHIFESNDSFWDNVHRLDNKQMLLELSWTRFVDNQIISFKPCSTWEQIYCDGKETSCRIDKVGMIGSGDKWWPTYIQWVKRYAEKRWQDIDWKDFIQRLKANHPDLEWKKKFNISTIQKQNIQKEPTWFVYPSEVFNGFECFMSWELVTIVAETNSWKTTFAMDLITKNAELWIKGFYINLEFNIETVRKDKRMWFNWKTKANLTSLAPMTESEKKDMNAYVKMNMSKFDSQSMPSGIDLEDLEELIYNKSKEWYELFVVDSFSKIHWNLDWLNARKNQNRCMEELQELVQKLWVAIVMLHHTNKNWTFEWTQKIADLSNVFILIQKEKNEYWDEYRKYILSKDKFVHNREICAMYKMWRYEPV